MAEVPSLFDKYFFGAVLPGYIAIILVVALFLAQFIPIKETNDDGFSSDFFTVIVLIIAGSAVGYSVRQIHRYIYTIEEKMPFHKKKQKMLKQIRNRRERDLRQ